ncbi:carbon-nitrogen hydrolase family protein [Helicobacter trogontum]|uniref:Carbon-nitrogen hydrolase family protein n=1 Tax=Helicobacter trogontum TaxID=50960 RepID=A0A4U8SBC2_9HELI|nr:carbon-nitrogen hydrolase family protein [Helicobacter trogontum]TLD83393.1 carbon-nitrogen hydrolase family protein [Helicobacter trogontum]
MEELKIKDFSGSVAILQLGDMQNKERITTYIKSIPQHSIVLIGEYIVDRFFSQDWGLSPESCLKDKNKLDIFIQFAKEYGHSFVVPFIQHKNKGYYKQMAIIMQDNIITYTQQRLIQYPHWNEANFFSNDTKKLPKLPMTFMANGIKFGVLFGFEAHFDEFWTEFKRDSVDVVLVATASTFASQKRWQNLLTTHAFTNSCYVFRANRIGTHHANDGQTWDFYGSSFVSLGQDIIDSLTDEEGMLCVELDKVALETLKKEWGFRG